MQAAAAKKAQEDASARIIGKANVHKAALEGDTALVQDHVTADAACVGWRDSEK